VARRVSPMRAVVVGVGNLLRTDDGVGIHVTKRLAELGVGVEVVDAAMGGVEILEVMRGRELAIIVDAIETGAEPGTVFRVNLSRGELPPVITHSHGADLVTTLRLGDQLYAGEMPHEVVLIAVEAEDTTTIGEETTPRVAAAIPEVINIIRELAER